MKEIDICVGSFMSTRDTTKNQDRRAGEILWDFDNFVYKSYNLYPAGLDLLDGFGDSHSTVTYEAKAYEVNKVKRDIKSGEFSKAWRTYAKNRRIRLGW